MKTRIVFVYFLVGLMFALIGGCEKKADHVADVTVKREWAKKIEHEDLENFYRVSDVLYRCAQPDEKGMKALQEMGIKTVVNLRHNHDDEDEMAGLGLRAERIRINTWDMEDDHVVAFLKIVRNEDNWPVVVHCQHGADRTGTMCAMYRIVEQGWSEEEALAEMTEGDYGFHSMWRNLPRYVRNAEVDELVRRVEADDEVVLKKD
ncbi:dual specificity protein phosphatase family protein [Planctomycetota bacterium]|nr:dual specificity protein phosphatase family protein [Planctomycetota bacterium]